MNCKKQIIQSCFPSSGKCTDNFFLMHVCVWGGFCGNDILFYVPCHFRTRAIMAFHVTLSLPSFLTPFHHLFMQNHQIGSSLPFPLPLPLICSMRIKFSKPPFLIVPEKLQLSLSDFDHVFFLLPCYHFP